MKRSQQRHVGWKRAKKAGGQGKKTGDTERKKIKERRKTGSESKKEQL